MAPNAEMNRRAIPVAAATAATLIFAAAALAQQPGPRITAADLARSDRFLLGKPDADIVNGDIAFRWIDKGDTFYYRSQRAGATRYLLVESATGKSKPLFDHDVMATALSHALSTPVNARNLPIERLVRLGRDRYEVTSGGKKFRCELTVKSCIEQERVVAEPTAQVAPDGRYAVFSRDYNLWLTDQRSGEHRSLTHDGVRGWSYGRPPESTTTEVSDRRSGEQAAAGVLWSPDGRRFVSYRLDERYVPELALVQAIPEDGGFRPKLHTYHYDTVGDKPSEVALFVYDVQGNTRTPIDYRALPSTFRTPLAMGHLWWSEDGRKLYLIDSPVSEPFVKLLEVNPDTGAARLIVAEHADTIYFPNAVFMGPPSVRVLHNGDVIWFSERSGWGHLYRYDGKTGKLLNAITQGDWLVRDIQRIDARDGYIYFSGNGREPQQNIYNRHLYRVRLDGTALQLLTPEPGDHDFPALADPVVAAMTPYGRFAVREPRIAPNGGYFIDHYSTVEAPGCWLLRRADGSIVAHLEHEDAAGLPPFTTPEPFTVKSADGRYDFYGVLSKPANFDPSKRYPVVEHIYPGPQIVLAPHTFAGGGTFVAGGAIFGDAQAFADLGFVVIQLDARGGPLRSKAFRDLSYRSMEKAGMLEDHIAALRQLAASRPWLDLDRVGIFGTSAGGFATAHALIDYPDFYKVGVAAAGNHEQRINIRIWGETFHGPPKTTDYDKVFAGRDVSRFKGRLLLAHGDMDDNVIPAHTLRLADALIKGNRQFDMLIMPNVNHYIGFNPYFLRIRERYFLKHLMGAELPSDADIMLPGAQR